MKTYSLKNIITAAVAIIIVATFIALAVIHLVDLTNQGLINWRN